MTRVSVLCGSQYILPLICFPARKRHSVLHFYSRSLSNNWKNSAPWRSIWKNVLVVDSSDFAQLHNYSPADIFQFSIAYRLSVRRFLKYSLLISKLPEVLLFVFGKPPFRCSKFNQKYLSVTHLSHLWSHDRCVEIVVVEFRICFFNGG